MRDCLFNTQTNINLMRIMDRSVYRVYGGVNQYNNITMTTTTHLTGARLQYDRIPDGDVEQLVYFSLQFRLEVYSNCRQSSYREIIEIYVEQPQVRGTGNYSPPSHHPLTTLYYSSILYYYYLNTIPCNTFNSIDRISIYLYITEVFYK